MFKMTLNQNDGVLLISYCGYFTVYDAKLFQRELELKLKNIRPEDYVLVIDMQDVRLSCKELIPLLNEIQKTYSNAPFRCVYSVRAGNPLKPKPRNKESRDTNWYLVRTIDEALQLVKSTTDSEKKMPGTY